MTGTWRNCSLLLENHQCQGNIKSSLCHREHWILSCTGGCVSLGQPLHSPYWLSPWGNLSQYCESFSFLRKTGNWGFVWDLQNFKIDTNIIKMDGKVSVCHVSVTQWFVWSLLQVWLLWDTPGLRQLRLISSPQVGIWGTLLESVFWAQWAEDRLDIGAEN